MAVKEYGVIQYRGLSSEEKPAGKNGDRFTEEDTSKTFVKGGTWTEEKVGGATGETLPETPEEGDLFFKTDEHRLYINV